MEQKRRTPAWTDRILWRPDTGIKQLSYDMAHLTASDHMPVVASFTVMVIAYCKLLFHSQTCSSHAKEYHSGVFSVVLQRFKADRRNSWLPSNAGQGVRTKPGRGCHRLCSKKCRCQGDGFNAKVRNCSLLKNFHTSTCIQICTSSSTSPHIQCCTVLKSALPYN